MTMKMALTVAVYTIMLYTSRASKQFTYIYIYIFNLNCINENICHQNRVRVRWKGVA